MKTQNTQTTQTAQPADKQKSIASAPRAPKAKPTRAKRTQTPTSLQIISNAVKTPDYTPPVIKRLMEKLSMNEKAFAIVMNVSPTTVRYWTSGAVKPSGRSMRLMQIFGACPGLAADIVAGGETEQ